MNTHSARKHDAGLFALGLFIFIPGVVLMLYAAKETLGWWWAAIWGAHFLMRWGSKVAKRSVGLVDNSGDPDA